MNLRLENLISVSIMFFKCEKTYFYFTYTADEMNKGKNKKKVQAIMIDGEK